MTASCEGVCVILGSQPSDSDIQNEFNNNSEKPGAKKSSSGTNAGLGNPDGDGTIFDSDGDAGENRKGTNLAAGSNRNIFDGHSTASRLSHGESLTLLRKDDAFA